MNTMRRLFALVMFALVVSACGSASLRSVIATTSGQRIAVVSLAINDYGGSLQGWNSARSTDLMTSRAATMVTLAEQQLARHWQVVPVSGFVSNPALQQMAVPYEVAVPYINGVPLPVVAPDRGSLIRARLTPAQAQSLSRITGANLLAVIYTEWGAATGGFIPTSKALAKTVMSIYDAGGRELYNGRQDRNGQRTLGAMGQVVVTNETIDEWVNAYHQGITDLINR